eukprot:2346918-Amphidinium_carterae.2
MSSSIRDRTVLLGGFWVVGEPRIPFVVALSSYFAPIVRELREATPINRVVDKDGNDAFISAEYDWDGEDSCLLRIKKHLPTPTRVATKAMRTSILGYRDE